MKKFFLFLTVSLLALAPVAAQTEAGAQPQGSAAAAQFETIIGEVTAIDPTARRVTVAVAPGKTETITMIEQAVYLLMPPGETQIEKGKPATLADVGVGDRVLIRAAGGRSRRLVLMSKSDIEAKRARDAAARDGRRLNGRVVSVDASKKLIVVQARGREGVEAVTIDASSAARLLRFAPDSMRPADAVPGSLADVRAGDSVRATGERSADGKSFKAEEVLSGAFARFTGTVSKVDAARGELTVTNEQAGQAVTLTLGARSSLRRLTPEFEKAIAERAGRREQRRASGQGNGQGEGAAREGRRNGEQRGERRDGEAGQRGEGGQRRGGPGGGGNFQQMMEGLPVVTLAELKKGDAVVVTITPGADASRATVVSLVTGAAEVLRSMQQFQRGPEGQRGMSPGLPGDVIGGGQGPTREPPR